MKVQGKGWNLSWGRGCGDTEVGTVQVLRGQEGWGRGLLMVEGRGRELGSHLGVCLSGTGVQVMGPL